MNKLITISTIILLIAKTTLMGYADDTSISRGAGVIHNGLDDTYTSISRGVGVIRKGLGDTYTSISRGAGVLCESAGRGAGVLYKGLGDTYTSISRGAGVLSRGAGALYKGVGSTFSGLYRENRINFFAHELQHAMITNLDYDDYDWVPPKILRTYNMPVVGFGLMLDKTYGVSLEYRPSQFIYSHQLDIRYEPKRFLKEGIERATKLSDTEIHHIARIQTFRQANTIHAGLLNLHYKVNCYGVSSNFTLGLGLAHSKVGTFNTFVRKGDEVRTHEYGIAKGYKYRIPLHLIHQVGASLNVSCNKNIDVNLINYSFMDLGTFTIIHRGNCINKKCKESKTTVKVHSLGIGITLKH